MIQIVLFVIGIFTMCKKSISVDKNNELRAPRTIIFGLITILAGVSMYFINAGDEFIDVIYGSLPVIIPVIAIFSLKLPKAK